MCCARCSVLWTEKNAGGIESNVRRNFGSWDYFII
jgi:hypothetical protein